MYLLKIRPIEITSTEIRNKILEGKDVSEFLLEEVNELPETVRGSGGFGSTGK